MIIKTEENTVTEIGDGSHNFTLAIHDRERGVRLAKTVKYEEIDDGGVLLLYEKDFEVENLDKEVIADYKLELKEREKSNVN